jgi:hypothetical protein
MNIFNKVLVFIRGVKPREKKTMSCEDASLLIANIDDIDEETQKEVIAHISDCPCCGNYHDQIIFINKKCREINNFSIKAMESESLESTKLDIIKKYCNSQDK